MFGMNERFTVFRMDLIFDIVFSDFLPTNFDFLPRV